MRNVIVGFLGLAIVACPLAQGAQAHPRLTDPPLPPRHHKIIKVAKAGDDDTPRVRIRGDRYGRGLTLEGFSHFISRHPALIRSDPSLRMLASMAPRRALIVRSFAEADTNHDGRVSAEELADFVTHGGDVNQPIPTTA